MPAWSAQAWFETAWAPGAWALVAPPPPPPPSPSGLPLPAKLLGWAPGKRRKGSRTPNVVFKPLAREREEEEPKKADQMPPAPPSPVVVVEPEPALDLADLLALDAAIALLAPVPEVVIEAPAVVAFTLPALPALPAEALPPPVVIELLPPPPAAEPPPQPAPPPPSPLLALANRLASEQATVRELTATVATLRAAAEALAAGTRDRARLEREVLVEQVAAALTTDDPLRSVAQAIGRPELVPPVDNAQRKLLLEQMADELDDE